MNISLDVGPDCACWWPSSIRHGKYRKTSNISHNLVGNKIVDHSDVVGASPVGAAPTTSSFSTLQLASKDSAKKAVRQYKNLLSVGIWCDLYQGLDSNYIYQFSVGCNIMGDKTIPDSAEPRLESFYPPFVAGIHLPHQGVVDSYNLYIAGWQCQTHTLQHMDEILGCCTPVTHTTWDLPMAHWPDQIRHCITGVYHIKTNQVKVDIMMLFNGHCIWIRSPGLSNDSKTR